MLWCVLCHSSHSDESSSTVYVIQYIVQIFIAIYCILYHILYCICSICILLYLLHFVIFGFYLFIIFCELQSPSLAFSQNDLKILRYSKGVLSIAQTFYTIVFLAYLHYLITGILKFNILDRYVYPLEKV